MSLRVLKFGGSSLATLAAIERIADALGAARARGDQLVVVCSAMGKATDDLLAMAAATAPGAEGRDVDMLVTAGERIAAALLSLRLGHIGVPAMSLTGSQSGIVTDGAHGRARVLAVRPHRVARGLAEGRVVVVAGFQGVSEGGEVTALARGGSDTTAVALAAALKADACEIYSDVDGVCSADPRLVEDARIIPTLDADAMAALARGGARVLAADAVALAKLAGIVIEAGHAERLQRRTRISPEYCPEGAPMAAIASLQACVVVAGSMGQAWPPAAADLAPLWFDGQRVVWPGAAAGGPGGGQQGPCALITVVVREQPGALFRQLWQAGQSAEGKPLFLGTDGMVARWLSEPEHEVAVVKTLHQVLAARGH